MGVFLITDYRDHGLPGPTLYLAQNDLPLVFAVLNDNAHTLQRQVPARRRRAAGTVSRRP
jgi:hypothetical protein